MANQNLRGKYFVRRSSGDSWDDVTVKWNGVRVLSAEGLNELGDAVNVYNAQWMDGHEDLVIAGDSIIRAHVDLSVTLIVSRRYASSGIDERTVYDSVVKYMCTDGSFYIKSAYAGKQAKVVCLKSVKPTTQKLNRGDKSYILVTIPLHTVEYPSAV